MTITTVNIDETLLKRAKERKINISAVCNEALRKILDGDEEILMERMRKLLDEYLTIEAELIRRLKKKKATVDAERNELLKKLSRYEDRLKKLKEQIEDSPEVWEIVKEVDPNDFNSLMDVAQKLNEMGYRIGALNIREYFELKQLLE